MPIDYSKWKKIDLSDDEELTHPNIHTQSLFKWRHRSRVERNERWDAEKKHLEERRATVLEGLEKLKNQDDQNKDTAKEVKKLKEEYVAILARQEEMRVEEAKRPWDVDTIGKEVWSKSSINKAKPAQEVADKSKMTPEERNKIYQAHIAKWEEDIKKYGMMTKFQDCHEFLQDRKDLACEETVAYLTMWCVDLLTEGKDSLAEHIAPQVISMQYVLEVGRQTKMDPRSCVGTFFKRIQQADAQYVATYKDEVEAFKERLKAQAQARMQAIYDRLAAQLMADAKVEESDCENDEADEEEVVAAVQELNEVD